MLSYGEVVLTIDDVSKRFAGGRAQSARSTRGTLAVDRVTLDIRRGETLALVGESGSGKTTLSRMVIGLDRPTTGTVRFGELDVGKASARDLKTVRTHVQMVFQDPYGSLHPRRKILAAIAEPWRIQGMYSRTERRERALALLSAVELDESYAMRVPGELSGGQRQRVAIARALALEPSLLILDEPVSALDVSMQAQILNLLIDLQRANELTYLLISHDLALVRVMADRVAVMRRGRLVELGTAREVYANPKDPYTKQLLDAAGV